MTTPAALTGASASITVDGIDLHTMGFLLTGIDNPTPEPVESVVTLPHKHGAFDFTKTYGTRFMTISGNIIGDSNTQLQTNIDGIKKLFRLKQNGGSFYLIDQRQTDRRWTCRYGGGIMTSPNTISLYSTTAQITIPLYCTKPYAEKITLTTDTVFLHLFRDYEIDYAGTFPTPLSIEMRPRYQPNLAEQKLGDFNESHALWTSQTNCTGADSAAGEIYGTNKTVWSRTAPGVFSTLAEIEADGTFEVIDKAKYYIVGGYIQLPATSDEARIIVDLGASQHESLLGDVENTGGNENWFFTYIKIRPAELTGATKFQIIFENDGDDAAFSVDGVFIYESNNAEWLSSHTVPPPYMSEPAADDWLPPIDPELQLHNSINIFPFENGVDWSATSRMFTVTDPTGELGNVLVHMADNDAGSTSARIWVKGSKVYRVSFKHMVRYFSATNFRFHIIQYTETEIQGVESTYDITATVTDDWTDKEVEITLDSATHYIRISVSNDGAGGGGSDESVIYLKDFMVVEAAAPGGDFDAYEKPAKQDFAYTGTIDNRDTLVMDFDRLIASILDFSEFTVANAIGNIITDRFTLYPDINILRYIDKRDSDDDATTCGAMNVKVSYRERYL